MGKLRSAFDNLVSKHEEYTNLLEDDEEFEKEELWIESCQSSFMKLDIDAKNYIESRDIPIESKSKYQLESVRFRTTLNLPNGNTSQESTTWQTMFLVVSKLKS